jgi:hypothetical protein
MRRYIYGIMHALKIGIAWYVDCPEGSRLMTRWCPTMRDVPRDLCVTLDDYMFREDVLVEWDRLQREHCERSWGV